MFSWSEVTLKGQGSEESGGQGAQVASGVMVRHSTWLHAHSYQVCQITWSVKEKVILAISAGKKEERGLGLEKFITMWYTLALFVVVLV